MSRAGCGKFGRLTLEERDHVDQATVALLSLPWLHDDSVVGLEIRVLGVNVKHDDLGQVTIQVRQVLRVSWRRDAKGRPRAGPSPHLDHFAIDVSGGLSEQLVRQVVCEGVKLLRYSGGGLLISSSSLPEQRKRLDSHT